MSWTNATGDYNDPYRKLNAQLFDELKKYLGYPPHNVESNTQKRCPDYKKQLEHSYGRSLDELLLKVGLVDFGEVASKPINVIPTAPLIRQAKATYEVSGLYFFLKNGEYLHTYACSTDNKYAKNENQLGIYEIKTLLAVLDGEIKGFRYNHYKRVEFIETRTIHTSIDGIREDLLLLQLSGLTQW